MIWKWNRINSRMICIILLIRHACYPVNKQTVIKNSQFSSYDIKSLPNIVTRV
jgi:hypothetical protein